MTTFASASESMSLPQWPRNGKPDRAPDRPPQAPESAHRRGALLDSHGRTIHDLRLSLTDRCNFRCVYCMDPDVRFAEPSSLLRGDEFIRIGRIAASLGIRKVRLTGGEPTLHPELLSIASGLRDSTGCEIALITNGSRGDRASVAAWRRAGIARVTVSLDSLREDRFARLTRASGSVQEVLACVGHCLAEGLAPVKVNAVLLHGENDDEAVEFADLARRLAIEVRFIEWMPLDSGHAWRPERWVSAATTRAAIESVHPLVPIDGDDPTATARSFAFADGAPGRIGFIAPISAPFCGACSRLRITADGMVRPCLFSTTEWDLRPLLRSEADDEALRRFLVDAAWSKQAGHGIESPEFRQPARPMSAIGG
ncbi:MAG: GTP 3',8-cyclase MoaA [Phycisphaerales bacterium]